MPSNLSHKNHPAGRPWKAQVSRRLQMSNGITKVKTIYLGMFPSYDMALAAEESYIAANMPQQGTWRFVWNPETMTMEVYTRND